MFTIIAFATAASAQTTPIPGHVKVFDGRSGRALAFVGLSSGVPMIDLPAGKPIRIDFSPARGDERYTYAFIGSQAKLSAPEIPCGGSVTSSERSGRGSSGIDRTIGGAGDDVLIGGPTASSEQPTVYLVIKMKPVYVTSFQTSAGTCRMLKIKLSNGSEYRGIVRFQ
jgi:hypothetical protein